MPSYPRILVIDPDAESRAEVQRLLVNSRYVVVGGVGYDEEAPTLASEFKPQVVLIAYQEPVPLALRALQAVKEAAPEAFIIAYSHRGDIQSVRRVILAGAWDYISRPVSLKDLSRSIELALAPASEEREGPEPAVAAPPRNGRHSAVVTVFSAKGGVGKTVLAVNLAAALAEAGCPTALVDLDTVFGDVARMTRLTPQKTFVDAVRDIDSLDESNVSSYLSEHPSGVHVLPAPPQPTDWRELDPASAMRVLDLLRHKYKAVVVDTPATFTDLVVVALEAADVAPVLTTLDPISVEATAPVLQLLSSSLHAEDRVRPTINHTRPASPLSETDAAEQLGRRVSWVLPYDQYAGFRDEAGRPLVLCRSSTRLSQSITEMAASLAGLPSPLPAVAPAPAPVRPSAAERVPGERPSILRRLIRA